MRAAPLILIFLAAGCKPSGTENVTTDPAVAPPGEGAQPAAPAFDPWPEGADLLPSPAKIYGEQERGEMGPAAALATAKVEYKTHVSVARIGAPRTGAEIGALIVEAGWAEPAVIAARIERVEAGLEALAAQQPDVATEAAAIRALWAEVQQAHPDGPPGEAWVQALEGRRAVISEQLAAADDPDLTPLVLAGCWLQIADAMTAALIETGHPELAPLVFDRADLNPYFQGYLDAQGGELFPESVTDAMRSALELSDRYQGRADLTMEELEQARELNQDILGML